MKKPESKKKFIISVMLMTICVVGFIVGFVGLKQLSMGVGNKWVMFAGMCIGGTALCILCSGMGDLFKIFFTTIFGKDKK